MRLRLQYFICMTALIALATGCGNRTVQAELPAQPDRQEEPESAPEEEPQQPTVSTCRITGGQVALVIDVSSAMDNGFNQAALNGAQTYADGAEISYSYYSADADTQEAYEDAVLTAIQNDAELVVCAGSHFEQTVGRLQREYGDVCFLLLDGVPRDASGEALAVAPNVHCITYREEEAGYLAGYMAVLEGYTKLGFIGGERLPSVERYGCGYLQGIDDAAAVLGNSEDVSVEYWYAGTFLPDQQIEEVSEDWYEEGTEIVFACGGTLYQSVLPAAESHDGRMIGVDVDQSEVSELFLTSAMKGIDSSVIDALDEFFASGRKWPKTIAGNVISYGAKEKCIRLPVQGNAWRFQNATITDYLRILAELKNDEIRILDSLDDLSETAVSVIYHNQPQEDDLCVPETK